MEGKERREKPLSAHVCVADLGSRPVEIQLTITLQGTKNGRGKPKVRVWVEEAPKVKRTPRPAE